MMFGRLAIDPAYAPSALVGNRRNQVELGPEPDVTEAAGPAVIDPVGLPFHFRLEVEIIGRLDLQSLQQVASAGLDLRREVLVEDENGLDPRVFEKGVPAGFLLEQLIQQVADRPVMEPDGRSAVVHEAAVGSLE